MCFKLELRFDFNYNLMRSYYCRLIKCTFIIFASNPLYFNTFSDYINKGTKAIDVFKIMTLFFYVLKIRNSLLYSIPSIDLFQTLKTFSTYDKFSTTIKSYVWYSKQCYLISHSTKQNETISIFLFCFFIRQFIQFYIFENRNTNTESLCRGP